MGKFSIPFGANLSRVLDEQGLTQNQLASKLGRSDASVSNYVRGESLPDLEVFSRICHILGCTAEELLMVGATDHAADEQPGLQWQIDHSLARRSARTAEIEQAIELFSLIAENNFGFDEVQATRTFAGYSEVRLRQLLRIAFLSGVVRLLAVERDYVKEEKLRQKFSPYLRRCIVGVTKLKTDSLITSTIRKEAVAFLAARHTVSFLPHSGEVALSGGTTISRFVDLLPPASPELSGITWFPLLVSKEQIRRTGLSANSVITRMVYKQPGAKGFRLSFLDLADRGRDHPSLNEAGRNLRNEVIDVMEATRHVSVAFMSVGSSEQNFRTTDSQFGLSELTRLFQSFSPDNQQHCVGDILLHLVDEFGQQIGDEKNREVNAGLVYSVGLDGLHQIASRGTVWILAAASSKAKVIKGALVSGLANCLVIDEEVADALLEL